MSIAPKDGMNMTCHNWAGTDKDWRRKVQKLMSLVQEQLARTEVVEAGQDAWPTGPHVLVFAETYSERDYKLTSFLFWGWFDIIRFLTNNRVSWAKLIIAPGNIKVSSSYLKFPPAHTGIWAIAISWRAMRIWFCEYFVLLEPNLCDVSGCACARQGLAQLQWEWSRRTKFAHYQLKNWTFTTPGTNLRILGSTFWPSAVLLGKPEFPGRLNLFYTWNHTETVLYPQFGEQIAALTIALGHWWGCMHFGENRT